METISAGFTFDQATPAKRRCHTRIGTQLSAAKVFALYRAQYIGCHLPRHENDF
jgi:hypothetical protein